jgi:hypothetical protein
MLIQTEPNMYYNDTGNQNPCQDGCEQNVWEYNFPLTEPGTQQPASAACGNVGPPAHQAIAR